MAPDDGSIRITPRDVYETVRRVETNVELLVWSAAVAEKTQADHEARLRAVEHRVWAIPSAAVLLAIASLVVAILSLYHGHTPAPASVGAASTVTVPERTHRAPVSASQPVRAQTPAPAAHLSQTAAHAPVTVVSHKPAPVTVPVTAPAPVVDLVKRLASLVVERAPPAAKLTVPAVNRLVSKLRPAL